MATSSANSNKNVKGLPDIKDPARSAILAEIDSEPGDENCETHKFTPELDPDCESVRVQLQSRGQGYLRHGDTLRANLQVEEPLAVSENGKKLNLRLPWPATYNDDREIVPVDSKPRDECDDIGYWSDRPGDHPIIDVGRVAWPITCDGEPVEEMEYDPEVGTHRTRLGHPVIHKPKSPSGCSFSPIWTFTSSTTGSLPADAKEPLEVGIVNEDCCCTLNLLFTVHYTYNIVKLQLPGAAQGINLAVKGYAGEVGNAPRCWTFDQCKIGNTEDKVMSGSGTLQVSIPPKSGTTVNFWTSIGVGPGSATQPQQYNFNTQAEVCWIGSLDC